MADAAPQGGTASFGEMLRQYRAAAGLSREALAERAGLSARGIQDLERGVNRAPRADTVALLVEALALPAEERAALEASISRHRRPYVPSAGTRDDGGVATPAAKQSLPIGRFLGALPDNPLVGRDSELRQVLEAVDAVLAGAGRLVTLVGEPGVGKTRLAQEVTLNLRERGVLIAGGRCYEPQQTVPYYPFLDALAQVYRDVPAVVRAEAPHRWPYLSLLLPDRIKTRDTPSAEGGGEQQRLFQTVTDFLVAISENGPLALLLDDLHWADSATLDLLQYLARHTRSHRLLLLGTYRDVEVHRQHPLRQVLRDLNREHLVERVAVRRLEQDGTAALMAATLGEREVSAEFAELVHRHTQGNPFFTDEVLRALIDREDLYREDGHWTLRAVEEIDVPESIRDAVGERLSHLDGRTQGLLRQASVLGQAFGFEELQLMSGRGEEEVEAALDESLAAGLVREVGRDGYEFNHALLQQALHQELSSRQRRKLHQAAGEALEQLTARGQKRPSAEVAHHFLEADDTERGLQYSLLACREAVFLGAWRESEQHSRVALQLARETGDQERELDALDQLALSLYFGGHYHESAAVVEEAMPIIEAGDDPSRLSMWLTTYGRFHMNVGRLEQATNYLERSVQLAERAHDPDVFAGALLGLAIDRWYRGEWAAARRHLERTLELVGDRDTENVGWAYVDLTRIDIAEGNYAAASSRIRRYIQKAENAASPLPPWTGLYGQWQLAHVDLLEGRAEEALARIESVRDDPRFGLENLTEVLPILAEVHMVLGDLDRARETADECVDAARETNYRLALPAALTTQGMVLSRQGLWSEAARVLEEAISAAHALPYPYAEARALYEYGMMLSRQQAAGENTSSDRARDALNRALTIFQKLGARIDAERTEQASSEFPSHGPQQ